MSHNNKVIYTSVTGGYDTLPQYEALDDSFDYICFTNDYPDGSKIGHWQIRHIPYDSNDKTRLSRYVKLNPHIALPDYEYSVWLDSNLLIVSSDFYNLVKKHILKRTLWGGIKHPYRNCIYQDAICCIKEGRDWYFNINKNIKLLKKDKFPRNYGLFENNLIFRMHLDTNIVKIDEMWWHLYLYASKRDQMSLFYVFWKMNFQPDFFFQNEFNTRNHKSLRYIPHTSDSITKLSIRFRIIYNYIWYVFLFKKIGL